MKPRLGFQIRVGMRVRVTIAGDKKRYNLYGFNSREQLGTLIKLDKGKEYHFMATSRWRGMPVIKLDSGKILRGSECFWTKAYKTELNPIV